jgi:hypothetical protein
MKVMDKKKKKRKKDDILFAKNKLLFTKIKM